MIDYPKPALILPPEKPAIIRPATPNLRPPSFLGLTMMARTWGLRSRIATAGGNITFVGSATGTSINGDDVTVTLSGISGLAENDVVIIGLAIEDVNGEVANSEAIDPTDDTWTEAASVINNANSMAFLVCYKRMSSSPDTSVVFPNPITSALCGSAAAALAFRGVHLTTALDVTSTTASSTTNGQTPNPPSITPSSANCCIVTFMGQHGGTGDTSPGSITDYLPSPIINATGDDNQDGTIGAAYRVLSGEAGVAQDPGQPSTWTATNGKWTAATLALRPA